MKQAFQISHQISLIFYFYFLASAIVLTILPDPGPIERGTSLNSVLIEMLARYYAPYNFERGRTSSCWPVLRIHRELHPEQDERRYVETGGAGKEERRLEEKKRKTETERKEEKKREDRRGEPPRRPRR